MVNKEQLNALKEDYKKAVMAYISVFEEKQDVIFEGWVGDNFGETACFNSTFISLSNIRYDINVNAPKEAWFNWYEHQWANTNVSYPNWLKMVHGIKRYYSFNDK